MDHILYVLNSWGDSLRLWVGERSDLEIVAMLAGSVLLFPFMFFLATWVMHIRITPIDAWVTRHLNAFAYKLRKRRKQRKQRR